MKHFKDIADKLIIELAAKGIECYIWHLATTGSVYIRFKDSRMCSVRIGNHDGRDHLKYKYNLRDDISSNHKNWIKDGETWRYYLQLTKWKELIPELVKRHELIQTWPESKFQYKIPSFKKKS